MKTIPEFIIQCLENAKGDDSYRAKLAFKGMTHQQMQEKHGQSGKTRQQILDGYLAHDSFVEQAIEWVKAISL
jgi:hypothetical protein